MTFPVQVGPSTITINRDDRVLVCQPDGRILGDDDGFFTRDTRFISGYDLWINGRRPVLLSSAPIQFFSSRFEFTNDSHGRRVRRRSTASRWRSGSIGRSRTASTRTSTSSTTRAGRSG